MKNIFNISILFATILVSSSSCEDPEKGPLFLYEDLKGGSYVRLVEESENPLVNLDSLDSYVYKYTVDFVDAENGGLVESYSIDLSYADNSGAKPAIMKKENYRTVEASAFSTNEAGFKQAPEISLTSAELLEAFQLNEADLSTKDEFKVAGKIKLTDGRVYTSVNSSATVNGGFFQGFFDFQLFVGCGSELLKKGLEEGPSYLYRTTSIQCHADSTVKTKTIMDTVKVSSASEVVSVGDYSFNDWSFGAIADCFGEKEKPPSGFMFVEDCHVVSFSDNVDAFGTTWEYTSTVSGNDWVITWENTDSGLSGVSTVTFPDGVPFTVK